MINFNVLQSISNTFTVPILALLMTQIITDTQVKNTGHICMTCKHFFLGLDLALMPKDCSQVSQCNVTHLATHSMNARITTFHHPALQTA
jgi:hypothetical protein